MTYEEALKHCEIMAYEEAIKELEQIPSHIGADCDGYEKRAISIAIEALEKQIPRTPIVDIYGDLDCMCPTCYRAFKNLKKGKMSAHCPDCGQSLNWEGIERR